jgi:hypothetical protein
MVKSKHGPVGWPTVIPWITVDDPEALVAFIQHVFGAVGRFRPERPSELRIGDSIVMVGYAGRNNDAPNCDPPPHSVSIPRVSYSRMSKRRNARCARDIVRVLGPVGGPLRCGKTVMR